LGASRTHGSALAAAVVGFVPTKIPTPTSGLSGCPSGSAITSPVPRKTTSSPSLFPNWTWIAPHALRCAGRRIPAEFVDARPATDTHVAPPFFEYHTPPFADAT
jgi:hypothetical protein